MFKSIVIVVAFTLSFLYGCLEKKRETHFTTDIRRRENG